MLGQRNHVEHVAAEGEEDAGESEAAQLHRHADVAGRVEVLLSVDSSQCPALPSSVILPSTLRCPAAIRPFCSSAMLASAMPASTMPAVSTRSPASSTPRATWNCIITWLIDTGY